MKVNQLLRPWRGDPRFTQMSVRAAALKKAGTAADGIVVAITAEFGPAVELASVRDDPGPYAVFGRVGEEIEPAALAQLELALRLPVAVRGALMPDAHPGYALPVGGVVALQGAVSPAMVGVDIGCRMQLSIFPELPEDLTHRRAPLVADLKAVTAFGAAQLRRRADHAMLADPRWSLTGQTRGLRGLAADQLGSSGSGNHFAELVVGEWLSGADDVTAVAARGVALPPRFWGLLTHSGSRGVGHAIATQAMRVAARETAGRARVPRLYEWLALDGEAGQTYWATMELAGDYARANHEIIHAAFARRAGLQPLLSLDSAHNFAWRVGEHIIHRKGATPAEVGAIGVIPGSMGTPAYVVAGLGQPAALWSAAHGAGRVGSRAAARQRISLGETRRWLAERDILVEGLSADEAPAAYKDIEQVMRTQVEAGLVRPLARLHPVAVIMAGEPGDE